MNSTEGHIKFQKNGRYFTLGTPRNGKKLLIALHGYGHLAEFFIRKFNSVDLDECVVLCPEGLNRFYQSGTNGRVGASWMTKEDRENDIEDYITFLNTLLERFTSQFQFSAIHLLGFSQGGATASRWLAKNNTSFDKFILWSTVFPPDMEPIYFKKFNTSKNYFVFGTKDEYYSTEQVNSHFDHLCRLNIPFQMINFDGNHNIDTNTLQKILNE